VGLPAGFGAGLCLTAAGWVIGLRPLQDNSFLTHLATGRLILDRGAVPSTDPYTFTASGEPWVVQSWLASYLYGTVEAIAGSAGLRVLMGLTAALVVALAWQLLRPASSLVVRLGLGLVFVAAGSGLWAERPFMLGLIALAVTVLAGEGRVHPGWLLPVGWLWTNSHGSFPLGIVYLLVVVAGSRLDGVVDRAAMRCVPWLAGGIVLGAVGPLGPRVLVFPVELLQRQDVLRNVIEWQSPTFTTFSQRAFILQTVLAVVLLARRPSYRHGLVLAVFVAAALLGARNLPVASLVLLPGMAAAAPQVGALRSSTTGFLARALVVVGAATVVLLGAARLGQPDFRLDRYPSDALAALADREVPLGEVQMAAPDFVGNFVSLVQGPQGIIFYDDRFDMFPREVSEANLTLVRASGSIRTVLDAYDIDLVLWARNTGTAQWLASEPGWRSLYLDGSWVLACRRGADLGPELQKC